MKSSEVGQRPRAKWRVSPIARGLVTACVTASVVSWCTPDGNLVVTLVPALVLGLVAAHRRFTPR